MGITQPHVHAAGLAPAMSSCLGDQANLLTGHNLVTDCDSGVDRLVGRPRTTRVGQADDGDTGDETGKGHSTGSHRANLLPRGGTQVYAAVA